MSSDPIRRIVTTVCGTVCALALFAAVPRTAETQSTPLAWGNVGRNPQHTAVAANSMQNLERIKWSAPIDLNVHYGGNGDLYYHYGSPVITAANTVIVPVRTGFDASNNDQYRIDAIDATTGSRKYSLDTEYLMPPHNWGMPVGITLTPRNRLCFPGGGGTILYRDNPDSANGATGRLAFYGLTNYTANAAAYNSNVQICTPITSDRYGNLFFGFYATGSAPNGLVSGFARIAYNGTATWVSCATASGDAQMLYPAWNGAPALSNDQKTLYIAVRDGGSSGYLVALDSLTMNRTGRVYLRDPQSGNPASLNSDGTPSPVVGPDGDLYYGVLENNFGSNHLRGWLLHFDSTLATTKTPAAFGWDYSPSVVPAAAVPSYSGISKYLLLAKYNNYVEGGGDGVNKVALLDPNATATEAVSGLPLMREVMTIAGPTPDDSFVSGHPNAVREWCLNTTAVDVFRKCAIVNNEDGKAYRWDFTTNTLLETTTLTGGIGQAYTPTVIGPDGTSYAMSNGVLFALGKNN